MYSSQRPDGVSQSNRETQSSRGRHPHSRSSSYTEPRFRGYGNQARHSEPSRGSPRSTRFGDSSFRPSRASLYNYTPEDPVFPSHPRGSSHSYPKPRKPRHRTLARLARESSAEETHLSSRSAKADHEDHVPFDPPAIDDDLEKCYNLSSVEAPQDSPPSETLIVRNLSREINPEVVKSYFEEHGSVKQFDELIGRRGMAFVTYNEISSAETAYRKLQGTVMNDSIISIEFEQTEPSNTKSRPTESNTNKNSPSETQITSGSLQEAKGDHPALDLSQAQPSTSKSADIPLVDSKLIQPESLPAEHEPKVEAKPIDGSDRLGEARKLQQMLSKIKDVNVPKTAPPSDPPASVPKPALSEQPTLRVESSWSSMDETVVGSQNSSDGDIDSPGLPSSADIASLMSWVQQQNASPQSQPAQTAPEPVPISWGSEKDNSIAMAHPSLDAPSANAVGQNMDVSMEGSFSTTPMPVPPVPVYPFVGYNSSMPWTNFTHSFGGGYGPMQLLPFSPSFLPLPLPPQPPIVPFTDQGTSSAVPTTAPVNLEAVEKLQKILSQILDHR